MWNLRHQKNTSQRFSVRAATETMSYRFHFKYNGGKKKLKKNHSREACPRNLQKTKESKRFQTAKDNSRPGVGNIMGAKYSPASITFFFHSLASFFQRGKAKMTITDPFWNQQHFCFPQTFCFFFFFSRPLFFCSSCRAKSYGDI